MATVTTSPDAAANYSEGLGVIIALILILALLGWALHLALSLHAAVPPPLIRPSSVVMHYRA